MKTLSRFILVCLLLGCFVPSAQASVAEDETLLKAAGIAVDGPGLLAFLKRETLSGAEQARTMALVHRLGNDSFFEREKASDRLKALLPRVRPLLMRAQSNPDEEIKDRLRDLLALDPGKLPSHKAAAIRLLASRAPEGAVPTLLDFLVSADDARMEDQVIYALARLGTGKKLDNAVLESLTDPEPARRGAAAVIVGRSGSAEQRERVTQLLTDPDLNVRFRAAQGLLAGRDRAGIPVLIALLAEPVYADRAEDLLLAAAGAKQPRLPPTDDDAAGHRAVWTMWWRSNGKIDLARAEVDLLPFNTALRSREAARQFLRALMDGEMAALDKSVSTPFLFGSNSFVKIEDAKNDLQNNVRQMQQAPNINLLGTTMLADEYVRTVGGEARNVLSRLHRNNEVQVLRVGARHNSGVVFESTLLVRLDGEQALIMGMSPITLARSSQ